MIEIVVADQAAIRLATQLTVFLFVHFLEDRALVPGRTLVALEGLAQFLLGNVHHADLELLIRLGVVHQMMEAAPCTLELLEVCVMHDKVELLADLAINFGNIGVDRLGHVIGDDVGLAQHLLGKGANGGLDLAFRAVTLRLEFLVEQCSKITCIEGLGSAALFGQFLGCHRDYSPSLPSSPGFAADTSDCSNAGSLMACAINFSAPALPSM